MNNTHRPTHDSLFFPHVFKYSARHSVPFALLPAIGILITAAVCGIQGNSEAYLLCYLPFCALSVLICGGMDLYFLYRSFPRKKDDNSPIITLAILLAGCSALIASLFTSFACAVIYGAFAADGHGHELYLLFKNNFTAIFILFFASVFLVFTTFSATALAILWGKKRKKRKNLSRTCLSAIPIFTVLALYFAVLFFLSSFTRINDLSNIASGYFLTENVIWMLITCCLGAVFAWLLLSALCLYTSRRIAPLPYRKNMDVK